MGKFNYYNCSFRDLPPFSDDIELQEFCIQKRNIMLLFMLSTPIIYMLILYIEKKCCKSKYKTL